MVPSFLPEERLSVLDGSTGAVRWHHVSEGHVAFAGPVGAENVLVLSVGGTPCEHVSVRILDESTGVVQADTDLGPTRTPGEADSNVVSHVIGDLNGDGAKDVLVELRAYHDDRFLNGSNQYTYPEGRLATPNVRMRGWLSLIDGATGSELLREIKPLSFGPGPLAGMFLGPSGPAVSALLGAELIDGEAITEAIARTADGVLWSSRVRVLPQPLKSLSLSAGPAFVTFRQLPVEPVGGVFLPTYERSRITVLNGRTGAEAWSLEWRQPLLPQLYELSGDLLVDDGYHHVLERRSGADGQLVWRRHYASTGALHRRPPVLDQDGDGFTDLLISDEPGGPVVFSGHRGARYWRPQYAPGLLDWRTLLPVEDLDGDDADDLVALIHPGQGGNQAPAAMITYSGRSGALLWAAQLPGLGDLPIYVASGRLRYGDTPDLVAYRLEREVTVFEGMTGRVLWTTSLSANEGITV